MPGPKKLSARGIRRELARKNAKVARDLERLWRLSPGGSKDSPIQIESASQVEVHARSTPCPICGGELRVEDHTAETFDGARLRVVAAVCAHCGAPRTLYFRLGTTLPS